MMVGGSGSSALIGERERERGIAVRPPRRRIRLCFSITPPPRREYLTISASKIHRSKHFATLFPARAVKVRTHLLPRPAYRRDVVLRAESVAHRAILGADVPPLLRRRGGIAVRGLVHGSGRGQGWQVGRGRGGGGAARLLRPADDEHDRG
jgi:hypothetical protein